MPTISIQLANKVLSGTGAFITGKSSNGNYLVWNEGGDTFLFHAKSIVRAIVRAIERNIEDSNAFAAWEKDGRKTETYTQYFKRVRLSDQVALDLIDEVKNG